MRVEFCVAGLLLVAMLVAGTGALSHRTENATARHVQAPDDANVQCGRVLDGLTNGRFDMQFQTATSTIAANWVGFGEDALFFEWAIASDNVRLPAGDLGTNCWDDLRVLPDVQDWVLVREQTAASNTRLRLVRGERYRVLVRATYRSGHQVVVASDGVLVIEPEDNQVRDSGMPNLVLNNILREDGQEQPLLFERTASAADRNSQVYLSSSNCPIDNANRCRQSQQRVGEILAEIYGPPVFSRVEAADSGAFLVNTGNAAAVGVGESAAEAAEDDLRDGGGDDDDDNDDDDDGNVPAWIVAPIVVVLLLLALCLLCGMLLIRGLLGGREDSEPRERPAKPQEFVAAVGDDDGKDYGVRGAAVVGAADTETRVEFPDTQIRRLSITHEDDAPGAGADERNPRRAKHPILSSASSSFRDYRSVGQ